MVETNAFTLDETSKKVLKKVASKLNLQFEIVKTIFEYTMFTTAIELMGNSKKLKSVCIPYFCKLGIRPKENCEEGSNDTHDIFFSPSDNLKNLLRDLSKEDYSSLENFLDKKIKKEIDSLN